MKAWSILYVEARRIEWRWDGIFPYSGMDAGGNTEGGLWSLLRFPELQGLRIFQNLLVDFGSLCDRFSQTMKTEEVDSIQGFEVHSLLAEKFLLYLQNLIALISDMEKRHVLIFIQTFTDEDDTSRFPLCSTLLSNQHSITCLIPLFSLPTFPHIQPCVQDARLRVSVPRSSV